MYTFSYFSVGPQLMMMSRDARRETICDITSGLTEIYTLSVCIHSSREVGCI